ncbi:MAG: hypothetical protein P8Z74_14090 [Acidobacteriota bacterium]
MRRRNGAPGRTSIPGCPADVIAAAGKAGQDGDFVACVWPGTGTFVRGQRDEQGWLLKPRLTE